MFIDKLEFFIFIVGGDWNCIFIKKDKVGGIVWKLLNYRNLFLIIMEVFDLVDI